MQKEDEQGGPPNFWTFLFFPPLGEPSLNPPQPGVVPYFWPWTWAAARTESLAGTLPEAEGFLSLGIPEEDTLISLILESIGFSAGNQPKLSICAATQVPGPKIGDHSGLGRI